MEGLGVLTMMGRELQRIALTLRAQKATKLMTYTNLRRIVRHARA